MRVSLNAELRLGVEQAMDMSRREFNAACRYAFGEGVEVSDVQYTFVGVTGKKMLLFRLLGYSSI